jgi:hypothetical protein
MFGLDWEGFPYITYKKPTDRFHNSHKTYKAYINSCGYEIDSFIWNSLESKKNVKSSMIKHKLFQIIIKESVMFSVVPVVKISGTRVV